MILQLEHYFYWHELRSGEHDNSKTSFFMKANRLIISLVCLFIGIAAFAQNEVLVPRYKLFPTNNMWIFLKLDTANGSINMVEYDTNNKNSKEVPMLNNQIEANEEATPGRFNLVATENIWTFILIDQVDGRTWQFHWSSNGKCRITPLATQTAQGN